jgi:hypothetical protein
MMKFNITIQRAATIEEIENYWQDQDYINLLAQFDFPEAESVKPENLKDMLNMAITDFEPNEAAAILLTYKLSERLSEGQIDQISNDMLLDKVSEEYPEIDLHYDLFNINQLLYKAYNGKFPNAKATMVGFTMIPADDVDKEITKEMVLKAFSNAISGGNVMKRLFEEKMTTDLAFDEAEAVIWELNKADENSFTLITSEYWLNKEELVLSEFEGNCLLPVEGEDVNQK